MVTYFSSKKFTLQTQESCRIEGFSETTRSSGSNATIQTTRRIEVTGKRHNQNDEHPVTWEFIWPDADIASLEEAMSELPHSPSAIMLEENQTREASVDVYPWLRVGWTRTKTIMMGFVEFKNTTYQIRALLKEGDVDAFREMLWKMFNN